jgi:PAS domain S-box-containing protein
VDRVPAVLYVAETGPRGRFRFVSPQIERVLGYTPEEWCADPGLWAERLHPSDREEVLAREAARRGEGEDYRLLHRDGHAVWVHDDATLERDGDGVPYWSGILLDITEVRAAQQDRLRLAAIVDSSTDAIIGSELDGTIVSWNAGAERLYGYTAEEAIGRTGTMLAPEDRPDEIPGILARISAGEEIEAYETVRRGRDGTLVDVSLNVSPLIDAQGRIVGASAIARDIGDRKHFESKLRFFADYDVLTGIFNRRRFLESVSQQVVLSRRYGPCWAVLILDLDKF